MNPLAFSMMMIIFLILVLSASSHSLVASTNTDDSKYSRCDQGFLQSVCPASHPVCCFQSISQIWAACCLPNSLCKLDEGICITYDTRATYENATRNLNNTSASTSFYPELSPSYMDRVASNRGFDMTISVGAIAIACTAVVVIVGIAGSVAIGMWASLKYDLYRMRREQEEEATTDDDDGSDEDEDEAADDDEEEEEADEEEDEEDDDHQTESESSSNVNESFGRRATGANDDDEATGSFAYSERSATSSSKKNSKKSPGSNKKKDDKTSSKKKKEKQQEPDEPPSGAECILCYTYKKNTVLLPCGHMCCCHRCSARLADRGVCPLCRKDIRATIKVPTKKQQAKLLRQQEEAQQQAAAILAAQRQQQQQQTSTSSATPAIHVVTGEENNTTETATPDV